MAKTSALTLQQKKFWSACLVIDVMSSEESNDSDDNGDENTQFIVRPPPWRSDKATCFLMALDKKYLKQQSKRSKVMSFNHCRGLPSDHPNPQGVPDWVLK